MTKGGTDENPMNSEIVKQKHAEKLRSEEVRKKISKTLSDLRLNEGFSAELVHRLIE